MRTLKKIASRTANKFSLFKEKTPKISLTSPADGFSDDIQLLRLYSKIRKSIQISVLNMISINFSVFFPGLIVLSCIEHQWNNNFVIFSIEFLLNVTFLIINKKFPDFTQNKSTWIVGFYHICSCGILGELIWRSTRSDDKFFLLFASFLFFFVVSMTLFTKLEWRCALFMFIFITVLIVLGTNYMVESSSAYRYVLPITCALFCISILWLMIKIERIDFKNFAVLHQSQQTVLQYCTLLKEQLPCQVVVLSLESISRGELIFFNEAASRLFSSDDQATILNILMSLRLTLIGRSENRDLTLEEVIKRANTWKKKTEEFTSYITFTRPDASTKLELKVGRVSWENVEGDAWLLLFNDLSIGEKLIELKSQSEYKDQMLASVSHDLRTPINSIINILELALGLDFAEQKKLKKYMSLAINSANSLMFLVNDILDMAQIRKGRLQTLNIEQLEVLSLVEPVINLLEFPVKKKGLQLLVDWEIPKSTQIYADRNRFQQILTNLLGNALKFTEQGHVKLRLSKEIYPLYKESCLIADLPKKYKTSFQPIDCQGSPFNQCSGEFFNGPTLMASGFDRISTNKVYTSDDEIFEEISESVECLIFHVEDTGIGMKPEDIKGLFTEFGKFEHKTNKQGVGLGLYISQKLAELMVSKVKGGIKAESVIGKGSHFWFPLEIVPADSSDDFMLSKSNSSINKKFGPYSNPTTLEKFHISILDAIPKANELSHFSSRDILKKEFIQASQEENIISTRNKAILVVDDDPINVLVLKRMLAKFQCADIETCCNGKEAINKFLARAAEGLPYDLIFMDWNMPTMGGEEASLNIRRTIKEKGLASVFIIAVSGIELSIYGEGEFDTYDHFLKKPISVEDIRAVLEKYLNIVIKK